MTTLDKWRKSSYSGSGDGNNCVEIANFHPQVAIRDSKSRAQDRISFSAVTFAVFICNLKAEMDRDIEGS